MCRWEVSRHRWEWACSVHRPLHRRYQPVRLNGATCQRLVSHRQPTWSPPSRRITSTSDYKSFKPPLSSCSVSHFVIVILRPIDVILIQPHTHTRAVSVQYRKDCVTVNVPQGPSRSSSLAKNLSNPVHKRDGREHRRNKQQPTFFFLYAEKW